MTLFFVPSAMLPMSPIHQASMYVYNSGDTLLRDNRRLIGRSLIVLGRSRMIAINRIYSEDIIPPQDQHKYLCFFPKVPLLRMYLDTFEPPTFTSSKFG